MIYLKSQIQPFSACAERWQTGGYSVKKKQPPSKKNKNVSRRRYTLWLAAILTVAALAAIRYATRTPQLELPYLTARHAMVLDVDSNAQFYGLPAGAYIESVTEGGAAEKGGILAGDIITEVGGFEVTSVSDLTRVLRKFEAGQTVSVEVYRTGSYKTISVVLDEKPREEKETQQQTPSQNGQYPMMPGGDDFGDIYEYFRKYFG